MKKEIININSVIKNAAKYICAIFILFGFSVSAWGTMYTDTELSADIDLEDGYAYGTFDFTLKNYYPGYTLVNGPSDYGYIVSTLDDYDYGDNAIFYDYTSDNPDHWNQQYGTKTMSVGYWFEAPGNYSVTLIVTHQQYANGGTSYDTQSFTISFTVTGCSKLSKPTLNTPQTRYDDSGTEKVRLSWSCGSDIISNGTYLKFECGEEGEDATYSYNTVSTSATNWKKTRTSFTNGKKYWWTLQALGNGTTYCNSDVVEGGDFCIDDVDKATPGGADGKSWSGSSLSTTSKRIGWTAISNADYYIVNITNKSTGVTIGDADREIATNSIDITDLTANVEYTISVVAYNACDVASNTGSADFGITAYTVTFNLNGEGSNAPSSQLVVKNGKANTPSDPTPPTGKHFDGWYKEAGCSNAWDFSLDVVTENTTLYAKWTYNTYSVRFNKNDESATGSMSNQNFTYGTAQNLTANSFSLEGYSFVGWALDEDEDVYYEDEAEVENLTSTNGATSDLYAKWTINSHKVTVGSPANVTITATPSGGASIAEGAYNASVNYGTSVTLSYNTVAGGNAFNSWVVTKDADKSDVTASVVDGNTLTMPDYDVTVSATMYAKAKLKTRCLQEPEFTVTGSVYLTSYANVEVYTTDNPDNRITITCSDFKSANRLYILYLNSSGDTIAKGESPFRLCDASTYNYADASNNYIDISAVNWSSGQKFCIAYKPGASEYNQTDTWTIRLTPRKDASTNLGHQDIEVHGRALPEKFVVAAPYNGQWYALPADMATSSGTVPTPYLIGVDNRETPTVATYANTKALFTGAVRYTAANKGGLRLKSTTTQINSNDAYVTAPNSASETYLWLATGASNFQDWYLTSSNFSSYTVQINPAVTNGRALRMFSGKIGYYPSSGSTTMYILPVTNEVTDIPATVQEWGEHGAILNASMTNVASATMHVDDGTPADVSLTSVNAASLTAGKYVRIYNEDVTVGDVSNDGKLLYVHWKDEGGNELGVSQIIIPCVVASSNDMKSMASTKALWSAKSEVHILPGVTLDANANSFSGDGALSVSNLFVYPGATLKVSTGTFNATTLRLRNGWTRAGEKNYDVARVYIADDAALTKTTASMDYDIYEQSDGKHYYPLAVPFETAVSGIDYADTYLAGFSTYGTHYVIKEYDGANRAANGEDSNNNWDVVSDASNLVPGKGYIMTAVAVKGEAIIRVPLVFDNAWTADGELGAAHYSDADHTKNEVTVTAHAGAAATANKRHAGWNMLGVPYMSCFASNENITHEEDDAFITGKMELTGEPADPYGGYDNDVVYVTVPTHDFSEYLQYDITDDDTKLLPGWSFFVQFAKDGTLTFANTGQTNSSSLPIYAPQRTMDSTMTRIKTGVILSTADGETSDKFGLIISDRYTQDYEVGADLEKMFGNGYTLATYSLSQGTRLAFNALSTTEAAQVIPVGYRAPEAGQYTFAINPRYATEGLLRVELIDYQTGDLTDLLTNTYTFMTSRMQDDTRFAIHVTYTDPNSEMPTGEAPPIETGETLTRKFILNGQLYIQRGTVIYDATGKEVRL